MTADPSALPQLWLADYAPEFHATEARRYPAPARIATALGGGELESRPLAIPLDCTDGFADSFYGRPEALLEPAVRRAQSAWSFVDDHAQATFVATLSRDLASGAWDRSYGHLRTQPEWVGSIWILIGHPPSERDRGFGPGRHTVVGNRAHLVTKTPRTSRILHGRFRAE
jgi:hypothetical protein